jgi:glycogen debranching enzyme
MPFDVVGRRAAVLGREDGTFEMWAYPLKVVSDFKWTFQITDENGTVEAPASQLVTTITVRPECTILTYTHAAFTVRQIMFVPIDQLAAVLLLDVDAQRPLRLLGSFRRELALMWPAETSESQMEFDPKTSAFLLTNQEKKLAGLVGAPGAKEVTLTDDGKRKKVSARFTIEATPLAQRHEFVPIIISGAPEGGLELARQSYIERLASIQRAYENTVAYYQQFRQRTLQVITPDARLNQAFEWAKMRVEKGYATNPFLGSGLLAGFRTSDNSLRPGFAWFFGRDALWTSLALTGYGDLDHTRGALQLLQRHQRADGKIMHELSQAASFVNWASLPYYYASADATPLYVIALEDYYRVSGDMAFLREMWPSAQKAYEFSASTDHDGNGLIENTNVGHGWVEGGNLLPAHEEIYLEGLWIEAGQAMARLAEAMGENKLAATYRQRAEQAGETVERLFWNEGRGFYAFARRPDGAMTNEITVMPAVPMWWGLLNQERGARMLEHIASAAIATDWGARILSNQSQLYDPLSYHYGSVWPLFTGWAAMAGYRYHRPLVGYELLMANAELTYDEALGAHTELLSGDRYRSFSFSSFDQVWSSAMIITPLLRGLLGLEWDAPARRWTFAPQLPADWDQVEIRNLRLGENELDLRLHRNPGHLILEVARRNGEKPIELQFLPSFPVDMRMTSAKVNDQPVTFEMAEKGEDLVGRLSINFTKTVRIDLHYVPGTELLIPFAPARLGDRPHGLKPLRTTLTEVALTAELEGLNGLTYHLTLFTPRPLRHIEGAEITSQQGNQYQLAISFPKGQADEYGRKTVAIEFTHLPKPARR